MSSFLKSYKEEKTMPEINVDTILGFIIGLLNKVFEIVEIDYRIVFKKKDDAAAE